jgi:hypothetical protein
MSASAQALQTSMGAGSPSPVWLPGITPDDIQFLIANVTGLSSTSPNGSSSIQIDNGYDFYWYALTHQADLAGEIQTESSRVIPLVTVLINDSSATRNLSNNPMPLETVSGTGEFPYRLIRPRLFPANTVISFTWVSYVAAGTTYSNIYHLLHGYRIRK